MLLIQTGCSLLAAGSLQVRPSNGLHLYINADPTGATFSCTLMDLGANEGSRMSCCSLKGGFILRTCRSSARGGVPSIALLSLYDPSIRPSCRLCWAQTTFTGGFADASGSSKTREHWACLLLIENAWSGLPGAVGDGGGTKVLMFVKASLYLPCVAGGMICCRKHIILLLIAPQRLTVAGFSLNFITDVTSCCCAMILMNMRFLSARWCRRAALFPPNIVCLVQMLQFCTTISHSVSRNLGWTSWGTESQSAENTLRGSIRFCAPSTCHLPIFAQVHFSSYSSQSESHVCSCTVMEAEARL